jgi:hypothetical protein
MATTRTSSTAIRLGITGDPEVKRKLEDIGQTGDAAAQRMAKSFVKAEGEVEAALARRERQVAKLNAIMPQTAMQMRVDNAAGTGFGEHEGSARRSSAVFAQMLAEQEQLEQRARALKAAIDPAWGAQQRFNAEIAEAQQLISRGAISLDDYVAKLRQEQAALDAVTVQHGRAGGSTNQMRQAMAGASYQVQDLVTQISMGANPITAFVVQGGQLAGQFQFVEGKAGAFARFLMGPWGLAIQVGMMALAPFIGKLLEGSDAADKQKKALEEHRKAVLALADAQEKAIQTAERRQALATAEIKQELDAAMATRQRTQAALELARANLVSAKQRAEDPMQNGEFNAGAAAAAGFERQIAALDKTMSDNVKETQRLQSGFEAGFARMITQRVESLSMPEGAIRTRYARMLQDVQQDPQYRGTANGARLAVKEAEIIAARDRELKSIEKGTQARDADTLTATAVAKMLRGALPGVQITNTTRSFADNKRVGGSATSHHLRGNAVDFVPAGGMSAMTKADVRQLFESRGIEIVELLGPGDKNHNDHFHVAWTKGKLSLDDFTDAAKRAKEEAEQLTGLRLFTGGNALAASVETAMSALREQDERRRQGERDILGISGDPLAPIVDAANDNQRIEADRWNAENARRVQQQENDLQILAGLWNTAFTSGTSGIWDMFKQQGLAVISELLARWMLFGNVKGAGGAAGDFLGAVGSLFGGGVNVGAARAGANAALDAAIVPRFAVGTAYAPGGWADVGEFGKERVWLPRGSGVSSARDTRRMAANDQLPPVVNHYHLTGNMMTPEFWAQVQAGDDMAATRGAAGGAQIGQAEAQAKGARRLGRRW